MSFPIVDWSELSLQVIVTFAHFLWQACAVAISLLILDGLSHIIVARTRAKQRIASEGESGSAALNYALACIAFFALPVCVLTTFAGVHQSRGPILLAPLEPTESTASSAVTNTASEPAFSHPVANIPISPMPEMLEKSERSNVRLTQAENSANRVNSWKEHLVALAPYLLIAFAVGVSVLLTRFGLSLLGSVRMRRRITQVTDSQLLKMVADHSTRLGLKRVPVLAICNKVSVPVVVGVLQPMILLPPALLCGLDPNQLAAILTHELAHIRRYDLVVNLLQRVLESLLFFHPVTWWISRRISIERENCCDDVAIISTDSLSYADALLRMAELCMHGTKQATALATLSATGTHPSQLGRRIRRLIGTEARTPIGISRRGVALTCGVLLATALSLSIDTSNVPFSVVSSNVQLFVMTQPSAPAVNTTTIRAVADNDWGPMSNGLRCRIVPVSPSMDAENIDMAAAVKRFKTLDDITFAVEIENVSDNAILLKDVRYGEDYSDETQGELNTNHYAPHLFDFVFTDADGVTIPRTQREFVLDSHAMILQSALVRTLAPGQTMKCLLKPAKFERAMNYRLPPGDFRAQVRYRSPSQAVQDWVKANLETEGNVGDSEKGSSNLWASQVESNIARFSISADGFIKPNLVWGAETDGLQAALEIRVPAGTGKPTIAPGVPVTTSLLPILHVKNVSDKPITLVSETGRQGDTLQIKTKNGQDVKVKDAWSSGWPIDVHWTIQPGEVAELDVLTPSLNQGLKPGEYSARYTIRFNSRTLKDKDGKQTFPAPGDYDSTIDTGWAPLFIREPEKLDLTFNVIDSKSGKAIMDAAVLYKMGNAPSDDWLPYQILRTEARSSKRQRSRI